MVEHTAPRDPLSKLQRAASSVMMLCWVGITFVSGIVAYWFFRFFAAALDPTSQAGALSFFQEGGDWDGWLRTPADWGLAATHVLLGGGLVVVQLLLLMRMFRTAATGAVFSLRVIRSIRLLGWSMGLHFLLGFLGLPIAVGLTRALAEVTAFNTDSAFDVAGLIRAAAVLGLAHVMELGLQLREEQELTV